MLQIELDTSVCSPQQMDATGNAFASTSAVAGGSSQSSAQIQQQQPPATTAAAQSGVIGDVLFDFPLSFTIHTELFLYRERFSTTGGRTTSGRRSPISRGTSPAVDAEAAVNPPEAAQLNVTTSSLLLSTTVAVEGTTTTQSQPQLSAEDRLEDSVLIRFTRTPYEFRHLLDTLAFVFPSLLLPKWPTVVLDRFPGDVLPARQAMAAFLQLTLHSLAALDDVVTHECFLSFIDHAACPRGKYQQMKIKRHLLDEEHALGRVQQHDRALQPLTANVSKNLIAAATNTSVGHNSIPQAGGGGGVASEDVALIAQLHLDAAFLRNLMATLQAFQAECLTARMKLQKELSDRQQRRKSAAGGANTSSNGSSSSSSAASSGNNGLLSIFSSKLLSLADLSVVIAKAGGGRTLDELPPHAAAHLGDRICSSAAYGTAMTGTISYLGPRTAGKKSDRLVGISWDDPLPFANTGPSFQQSSYSSPTDVPSSPSSPGATLTSGHWSGAAGTNGKFACRRDQGSMQRWSQVFRDPCEDVTIAAILETCVAVDRCLNPPEVGPFGTALVARNGAWVVGALAAVSHFEASVTQWCSKIITSYRTFLIAQHWIGLQSVPSSLSATAASTNATAAAASSQFDVKSIQQHVKALGSALSVCMTDFRSAWACYGAARKSNHGLVAERYVALVALFDHVEPNRFSGSWLRSRASAGGGGGAEQADDSTKVAPSLGCVGIPPPPSRRVGHYGKGTLDGVLMEVDAELGHLML